MNYTYAQLFVCKSLLRVQGDSRWGIERLLS